MRKKQNTKITLRQAIKWYNSNNNTLRTLALSMYTKDELKLNLKYIYNEVHHASFYANVPTNEIKKYTVLIDLTTIAKFLNGSWKKTINNTGYFLGNCDNSNDIIIYQHRGEQYAGIVYFKNKKAAITAIEILGKRIKNLFN